MFPILQKYKFIALNEDSSFALKRTIFAHKNLLNINYS